MTTTNVYLHFNGNAEEAFNFYRSVFGGEFAMLSRNTDIPSNVSNPTSGAEANKILHVALPISKETMIMGGDVPGSFGPVKVGGNFAISVNTESKAEADRIFNALAAGGQVAMPMDKTFWGSYFGMCTDKFSVGWMVSFEMK